MFTLTSLLHGAWCSVVSAALFWFFTTSQTLSRLWSASFILSASLFEGQHNASTDCQKSTGQDGYFVRCQVCWRSAPHSCLIQLVDTLTAFVLQADLRAFPTCRRQLKLWQPTWPAVEVSSLNSQMSPTTTASSTPGKTRPCRNQVFFRLRTKWKVYVDSQCLCVFFYRVYLENGETNNPPQPTVRPAKTEICTFTKSGGATGCVGVMTYDLLEQSKNDFIETLAIMFSVPWDYNLYKNWFAVGIYKKGRNCDKALYKEMYNDKKQHGFVREEAHGSGINHVGDYLDIKATMCPLGNAIMKVEVWDKLFTPHSGHHGY